jgi:ABC-type branched-subunit amino acid transport system permease subunit
MIQQILLIIVAIVLGAFFGWLFGWYWLRPLAHYLGALILVWWLVSRRKKQIVRQMTVPGHELTREVRVLQGQPPEGEV